MDWERIEADHRAVAREVLSAMRLRIEDAARDMACRLQAGNKVMFCGNGGSAADAQHFAAELVNRFLLDRGPYAGLALTTDTSTLTSIANDDAYDAVFSRQVLALGRPGDLLVAISTSGNSPNVCRAVAAARSLRIRTLALVGGDGGRLAEEADAALCVSAARHTPRVQEGHLLVMHLLCERVEELMTQSTK